jgi:hypothetical protein
LAQKGERDSILRDGGDNPDQMSTETFLYGRFDDGAVDDEKDL